MFPPYSKINDRPATLEEKLDALERQAIENGDPFDRELELKLLTGELKERPNHFVDKSGYLHTTEESRDAANASLALMPQPLYGPIFAPLSPVEQKRRPSMMELYEETKWEMFPGSLTRKYGFPWKEPYAVMEKKYIWHRPLWKRLLGKIGNAISKLGQ